MEWFVYTQTAAYGITAIVAFFVVMYKASFRNLVWNRPFIIMIIIFFPHLTQGDWFLRFALSLQLGGAVGNLIDRIKIGHVTDFISIGNFAVFNLADASVTVGVGIMVIGLWLEEKKKKDLGKEEQSKLTE